MIQSRRGLTQCEEVKEQFLELFSQTLFFLGLKDVKISLYIIVLIVGSCFDKMRNVPCRV